MDTTPNEIIVNKKSKSNIFFNLILIISILFLIYYYFFSAPIRANDVIIHIAPKTSLLEISEELELKKVINNSSVFKIVVSILLSDKNINTGDYLFKSGESFVGVTWQIINGIHGVSPVKITFTEGMTIKSMSNLLADKIPSFRKDLFLSDVRAKEGYLFPDTYFIYSLSTTDEILDQMTGNFTDKINSIQKEIDKSGKKLSDIIIMASIIEKEASGKVDSGLISGILWKRIKLGMLLQVDAAPITYEKIGLPSYAISNPGLSSILAAIKPEESPYLFYLHDNDGITHYAESFSDHRSNIATYLK